MNIKPGARLRAGAVAALTSLALAIGISMVPASATDNAAPAAEATGAKPTVTVERGEANQVVVKGQNFNVNQKLQSGLFVAIAPVSYKSFWVVPRNEFIGAAPSNPAPNIFTPAPWEKDGKKWVFTTRYESQARKYVSQGYATPLGEDNSWTLTFTVPENFNGTDYAVFTTLKDAGRSDPSFDTKTTVNLESANAGSNDSGNGEGSGDAPATDPAVAPATSAAPTPAWPEGLPEPSTWKSDEVTKCPIRFTQEQTQNAMVSNGLRWGINRVLQKTYDIENYSTRTEGDSSSTLEVSGDTSLPSILFAGRITHSLDNGELSLRWPGYLDIYKRTPRENVLRIGMPRIVVHENGSGSFYIRIAKNGTNIADAPEKLLGNFAAPVWLYDDEANSWSLRVDNGKLLVDPAVAAEIPGYDSAVGLPNFSLKIPIIDGDTYVNAGKFISNVWDASNHCGKLPWMRFVLTKPAATPAPQPSNTTPAEPVGPPTGPAVISVEEENKNWNEPASAAAAPNTLRWGIKASWRRYVGAPHLFDGATLDGNEYVFPNGKLVETKEDGTKVFQFEGRVHFEAYGGILYLTWGNPRVTVAPDGSTVLQFQRFLPKSETSPASEDVPADYFNAVTVDGKATDVDGTVSITNAPTYLTKAFADIFTYAYRQGLRMSNISFNVADAAAPAGGSTDAPVAPSTPADTPAAPTDGSSDAPAAPSAPADAPAASVAPADAPAPSAAAAPAQKLPSTGVSANVILIGALLAAGGVLVVLRRRYA